MAVIVSAEAITVRTADRVLLDSVSLGVQNGDRIGVLGLNGAGKTTLLSVLAGQHEPDSGRVAMARDARVAFVDQSGAMPPGATVRQVVLGTVAAETDGDVAAVGDAELAAADHVWASDSSIRSVLNGLGMTGLGLDSVIDGLSGGERRRVSLAAALVTDAELTILDEPTNHLDLDAIAWLAGHLDHRRGAVVVVTHDRWFLDAVALTTWEVVDGAVRIREGGYSDWVFARAERVRMAAATEERRRNLARKELAWLQRGAKARTSKPKFRVEAAEEIIADVPPPRDSTELVALARHRLGKDVLELTDVTVTLPGGRVLLDDVTRLIGPGERVAIVGPNGAGKSTLLRVLAGEQDVESGRVKHGKTVRIGFVHQHPDVLDPDLRVLQAISEVAGSIELGGKAMTVSQLAERFGFAPSQQRQQVSRLSGGERRRLQLLRVLATEPNVLLLDEPTNDLDTDTLTAMEDLLDTWAGTLVVVSHDRYLVERIADTVLAVTGDGSVRHRPGGVEQYLADQREAGRAERGAALGTARGRRAGQTDASALGGDGGATPVDRGGQSGPEAGERRLLRKDLQRLERKIGSLRRKETQLHEKLADVGADYRAAEELNGELRGVTENLDEIETQWLETAEQIEG